MFFLQTISKKLIIGFSRRSGVNFFGRKTVYTQGGGFKNKKRIIDYKRVQPLSAIILTIEKQNRLSSNISLICYQNGLFNYILLTEGFKIGDTIPGFNNSGIYGSSSRLGNIKNGTFVHHVELRPNCGAQLVRAAGLYCFLIGKNNKYGFLKMRSGWLLNISLNCVAIIGTVSNFNHINIRVKNAGLKRKMGFRPRVRGVAMNPCDHAHGGGEGRSSPPVAHKTPYGKLTKVPTIRNKQYLLKKRKFKVFLK